MAVNIKELQNKIMNTPQNAAEFLKNLDIRDMETQDLADLGGYIRAEKRINRPEVYQDLLAMTDAELSGYHAAVSAFDAMSHMPAAMYSQFLPVYTKNAVSAIVKFIEEHDTEVRAISFMYTGEGDLISSVFADKNFYFSEGKIFAEDRKLIHSLLTILAADSGMLFFTHERDGELTASLFSFRDREVSVIPADTVRDILVEQGCNVDGVSFEEPEF